MKNESTPPTHTARRDRRRYGGAAVEFALVFPAFFVLLYGMVNYGLVLALQQSLVVASEDAARAAVACDPAQDEEDHADCVTDRARAAAGTALAWLPAGRQQLILGDQNSNVGVVIDDDPDTAEPVTVTVTLEYPNYAANPLLPPLLSLSYIETQIPPLPSRLAATSVIRL